MTKAQKKQTIEQLAQDLQNTHCYFADSQGLNAQEVSQIRYACFEVGVKYQIVKNTLLLKALQKINNPNLDLKALQEKVLKGSTGLFTIQEDPSKPAKLIQAFHKKAKQKKPELKAAFVYDDLLIGKEHLKGLTQLKSKEELIAEIIQLLQAPTHNLLSALKGVGGNLAGSLKTISEKNKPE